MENYPTIDKAFRLFTDADAEQAKADAQSAVVIRIEAGNRHRIAVREAVEARFDHSALTRPRTTEEHEAAVGTEATFFSLIPALGDPRALPKRDHISFMHRFAHGLWLRNFEKLDAAMIDQDVRTANLAKARMRKLPTEFRTLEKKYYQRSARRDRQKLEKQVLEQAHADEVDRLTMQGLI